LIVLFSKPKWLAGLAATFILALGVFNSAALVQPKPSHIPWKCALDLPNQQYATVVQEHMEWRGIGFASRSTKSGYYIKLNSRTWGSLPAPVQSFFFFHECAHLTLGHLNDPGTLWDERKGEVEADCWAIRRGSEMGLLDRATIDILFSFIERFGVSSPFHKSGKFRTADIRSCLSEYEASFHPTNAQTKRPH
jgi:hypothetical protein